MRAVAVKQTSVESVGVLITPNESHTYTHTHMCMQLIRLCIPSFFLQLTLERVLSLYIFVAAWIFSRTTTTTTTTTGLFGQNITNDLDVAWLVDNVTGSHTQMIIFSLSLSLTHVNVVYACITVRIYWCWESTFFFFCRLLCSFRCFAIGMRNEASCYIGFMELFMLGRERGRHLAWCVWEGERTVERRKKK